MNDEPIIEVGAVYSGKVERLMDFGAFVSLASGQSGLVHISQIHEQRVENAADFLSVGQVVAVKVLEKDKQGRIRLSMKDVDPSDIVKNVGGTAMRDDVLLTGGRKSPVLAISHDVGSVTRSTKAEDSKRRSGVGLAKLEDFENTYRSLILDWNRYTREFDQRARSVINEAEWRVKRIQIDKDMREKQIQERYESDAAPQDLNVRPITIIETVRLMHFQEHWWKFSLAAMILGWIRINLYFGVFAAIGTAVVHLWWLQRRQHKQVSTEQARLDAARHFYTTERSTAARLREELAAEISAKTEPLNALYVHEKMPLVVEWTSRSRAFNVSISEMRTRLDTIIAEVGAHFAAPDENDPVHDIIPDLRDQLLLRIGERDMGEPAQCNQAIAMEIGLIERPAAIGRRSPVFHNLGARKPLFIDGGLLPASAAPHRVFDILITRALRQIPAGKVTFTLIDPLGLGSNFSAFLKLQDYSETLINGTVWTNRDQIKRRLRDTIEHIERVTQKYLRADYPDIESYNLEAQEIAEPYRLICIADFPESFDDETVRDLTKIVQNGPRCGVHAVIYRNSNVKPVYGINLDELLAFCQELRFQGCMAALSNNDARSDDADLFLDAAPTPAQIKRLVDSFGAGAIDAMKVEVPFAMLFELAKLKPERWADSSAAAITVPLGPSGAKKALSITFDSKLSHNALVVGRPGSGKSNLIHVFISMVCDRYSPDEVELYLVDFKKGVEFKDYANFLLPHARVIAVESEREFGISVLRALDKEMTVRSELFKQSDAAENLGEYRARNPEARMPRAVLIVDEFQEFFTKEDKIKTEASLLFDRLVRQGRSFGIHLMLGTQTLANSGLARSTIDQIPIRIALQCSDADSRLILADDNVTARALSRPGEAIYNDKAGLIEGNKQFQVALFGGSERKAQLGKLVDHVASVGWVGEPPRIFEGHESAALATCKPLLQFKQHEPASNVRLWLGEPVSLDDPVYCNLPARGGRNLLVLAREEEQGTNVMLAALTSLSMQFTAKDLRVHIVDLTTADASWADFPEALRDTMPQPIDVYGRHGLRDLLPQLRALVKERQQAAEQHSDNHSFSGPRTILAIIGAHRARDLRLNEDGGGMYKFDKQAEDVAPDLATCLKDIVTDGPDLGVNTMLWLDNHASFERIFERRVLNEFGIRISGALSEKDSHTLFDNQIAAQIVHPNRMVKFDDDLVGVYELFRPYAVGSAAVFEHLKERISVTVQTPKGADRVH